MDLRALIFMPALVGAVVFGFVFLLFASHYYLTVLESTAAGGKDVTWVSEPITDNFGRLWYMLWLVGLWLGPAYLIGRVATAGDASPWVKLAVPLLVFWLCYPVSQLSSLSATTVWLPFVPDVPVRLLQKPGVVLGFLVLSAVALAAFAVGFRWAFLTEGEWEFLLIGAPLMVVAAFVYARLIGRLAFALRFTRGLFPEKRKKKAKAEATADRRDRGEPAPVQPRDLPPLESPDGELTGYDILTRDDDPPRPKKRVRAEVAEPEEGEPTGLPEEPPRRRKRKPAVERAREWTDEDDEAAVAYGVREAEATPEEASPKAVVKPTAEEERLLRRDDAPKKPKRVWGPELLSFLGQPGTVSAILIASALCFAVGVMVRVCREFNPADGGG
jgi:hypothetical protein